MLKNILKEKGFLGNTKSFNSLSKMNAASPKNFNALTRAMFANGEQGFAYDNNDLSTLFQDAAGTTPVTGPGQPVGLQLDKSKGLVLGSELVTNGDFSSSSGWTLPAGTSVSSGKLQFASSGATLTASSTVQIDNLKFYTVTYTIDSVSGGGLRVIVYGNGFFGLGATRSSPGTYTEILNIVSAGGSLNDSVSISTTVAGTVATIDNISVRELPGNHRFQTTAASRPILRQSPILGPELVSNGAFDTGTGWTLSAGVSLATEGVQLDAQYEYVEQSIGVVQQRKYIVSYDVLSASGVNPLALSSGGFTNTTTPIPTSTTKRNSVEVTCEDSAKPLRFIAPYTGTTVVIDNISVREIQGYYTDRNYLEYDGVDDFLQTNSVDFTGTDKVAVFAGVRKLSDTNPASLIEFGNFGATSIGIFGFMGPVTGGFANYNWRSNGNAATVPQVNSNVWSAGASNVIVGVGNISGDGALIRVDGVQAASSGLDQGTGNYGNHPVYFGRRAGTTYPFNGHEYSMICVGRLTSTLETKWLEKLLAKRTGVLLTG